MFGNGTQGNSIRNFVKNGEEAVAPNMGGKIVKKDNTFYLVTEHREMEIPEEVLELIKIRKENNQIIAYSE